MDDHDPYCYPNTNVLINRYDLRDGKELERVERQYTQRQATKPVPGFAVSYEGYKAIHRHLFQDVYEWAGSTRADHTTISGKSFMPPPVLSKGRTTFQPVTRFFEQELRKSFVETKQELDAARNKRQLTSLRFGEIAARHIGFLNDAHPFREGNGRSMRVYLKHLAGQYGKTLEIKRIDGRQWLKATQQAMRHSEKPLARLIEQATRDQTHTRSADRNRDQELRGRAGRRRDNDGGRSR